MKKNCLVCGKPFQIPPSLAYKRTHCSKICDNKARERIIIDGVQTCNKCQQLLPITQFHKANYKPSGYSRYCKDCTREMHNDYNERNREKVRIHHRDYMRRTRLGQNGHTVCGIKNKRLYPPDNRCELCKEQVRLIYHHWDDNDFSKGMWICTKCHFASHWLEKYNPQIYYSLKEQLSHPIICDTR